MSNLNWQKVETIVDQALEIDEERRNKFIEKKCGDDERLIGEVTTLLESIFDSEGWLEEPGQYKKDFYKEISEDVELPSPARSLIGSEVGAYTVKEKIGEGGMGRVYLAERSDGTFDHKVAIKIVRNGLASGKNVRRFKREQQILAGFNHPGIARLYDGGVTGKGFPYFIMEYVNGTPIDLYYRKNNCSVDEKISLFKQVLEAVRHAHQNLVIHRDLKPDNILVTDSGEVKILDFGISKLLEEDPEDGILTRTGSRLLTPRYAAPEQIRQQPITTATDMYALGIVFYQLLADTYPLDLDGLSRYESEQIILENTPAKPSSRVSSSILRRQLQGDLDAIALKAVRKEPNRRYREANEFLDDLIHYQDGIPVTARDDSFTYRAQKFFKRHRRETAVAAGIFLLLIGFAGLYTWRITEERNRAQLAAQEAELQAAKAEEVSGFLLDLFESSDPLQTNGEDLTARQLLDRGLERSQNMENAEVRAEMLEVIGEAYANLGFQQKGEDVLDRSIEEHKKLYSEQSLEMAAILLKRGVVEDLNYDIAHPYFKEAYQIYSQNSGTPPLKMANVAEQLAYSYRYLGNLDSAEYFARRSLQISREQLAENDGQVLEAKSTLAYVLRKKNELQKAEKLYLDVISKRKTESSEEPLELGEIYNNLAFIYFDQENYEEAAKYLRKALKINERIFGPGHAQTLRVRSNLAGLLEFTGQKKQIESLYRDNLKYASRHYPENHWKIGEKYATLGYFLTEEERYRDAESLLRKSSEIYKKDLGQDHIWTASEYSRLAANLYHQNKTEEADSLFKAHYNVLKEQAPDFRRLNVNQIKDLINLYDSADARFSRQIDAYRELIEIAEE